MEQVIEEPLTEESSKYIAPDGYVFVAKRSRDVYGKVIVEKKGYKLSRSYDLEKMKDVGLIYRDDKLEKHWE